MPLFFTNGRTVGWPSGSLTIPLLFLSHTGSTMAEEPINPRDIPILEVCVDNLESAINAKLGGASRLELCSSLAEGGLTPTLGFVKKVRQELGQDFPLMAMLRPRGGDFLYSEDEIEIMREVRTMVFTIGRCYK